MSQTPGHMSAQNLADFAQHFQTFTCKLESSCVSLYFPFCWHFFILWRCTFGIFSAISCKKCLTENFIAQKQQHLECLCKSVIQCDTVWERGTVHSVKKLYIHAGFVVNWQILSSSFLSNYPKKGNFLGRLKNANIFFFVEEEFPSLLW